jgi:transposase
LDLRLLVNWDCLQRLQELTERLDERIRELSQPDHRQIQQLAKVVGIDQTTAESIVAEVGVDSLLCPPPGKTRS